MIEALLRPDVQQFVREHEQSDERALLLKHKTLFGLPASFVVNQIVGKRKSKTKIPLYYHNANIVFPQGINLEQSSSEETARFKVSVLDTIITEKNLLVDLTGGFGVDSYFFSTLFGRVLYAERNGTLLDYAKHNHVALSATNITHHHTTAEDLLERLNEKADCVFIDPSRRTTSNQKVFKLIDCEPNVVALLPQIFKRSKLLLIKTSPLLDIQQALHELACVRQVWVVSVDNECKELLFLCEENYKEEPLITAVNLPQRNDFTFTFSSERNTQSDFSDPLTFLYEPNASILKAGAFKQIAQAYKLFKLHASTHLYTSETEIENFPGRIFRVEQVIKPDAKTIASVFPDKKANVLVRNYPLTADALKKKLNLKDGGSRYLIACSGEKQKFVMVASRVH